MPADPGKGLGKKRLKTAKRDIGHVAPCFSDSKRFNTLVIRPEYRISLELGDIDSLCPELVNTDRGREMRLQLLAYLYDPIKAAPDVTDAFSHVWTWFTGAAPQGLGKADADLTNELTSQIVEHGRMPKPGEIHKVFFPGGCCYHEADQAAALSNAPTNPHARYRREQAMWEKNAVLGAIPVIAKVERQVGDDWRLAPDVWVYLQLQKPDALPANHITPGLRNNTPAHVNTPPAQTAPPSHASLLRARNWPNGFVESMVADRRAPIDDPQVDNCHMDFGGNRGRNAAGNAPDHVFELKQADGSDRAGFYRAHDSRVLPDRPPFYNLPQAAPADGDKHLHAVRAKTNKKGEAGFIFRPSRTAGDRYKLRAYVGPAPPDDGTGLENDGTGIDAVVVDTGTFVVWRRIRVARYLQWPHPGGFAPPAFANGDSATNMQNINLATVQDEYRKAYIDMVLESTAAQIALTLAEWNNARNHAIARLPAVAVNFVNYGVLFPAGNNTPCLFNIPDRATYNAGRGVNSLGNPFPALPAPPPNTWWNVVSNLLGQFIDGFMHWFTRDALPFVFIQAPFGDMQTFRGLVPAVPGDLTTSGVATPFRGCYLFGGQNYYTPLNPPPPGNRTPWCYPTGVTHNAVHESGHCHYGAHHWTDDGPPLAGGVPADHDQFDYCIMGYIRCDGDFCGRCLLKLRGWNVGALPANWQRGPKAHAGSHQTVSVGDTVTLNGEGSREVGNAVTFSWSLTAVPADSTAALSDATVAGPTFQADKEGTYVARLVVNNGAANSTPDTVTIIAK